MLSGILNRNFIVKFILTAAALGILGAILAVTLIFTGAINLAANTSDPKWFYNLVHGTFKRWVAVEAYGIEPPEDLEDEGRIALGAQHFAQNCVRCHGAPGIGQNPMVLAMKPTPQHLPSVIDQFTDAELYVILEKGVMMSAMPAWPAPDRPDEIWSTVAFIRQLGDMDAATYVDMVSPEASDAPEMEFGPLVEAEPMDFYLTRYPMEEHLYAAPTGGFADYALAGVPVAQCATCHGAEGDGAPTTGEAPNLTIQSPDYLSAALQSYAAGDRHSGYMQVVASQLSDSQIDALANYYGDTLETKATVMDEAPDAEVVAQGETLAMVGRPEDGISACLDCHGRDGTANADGVLVPRLAGQSQVYMARQLRQFRSGGRGHTSTWSPMTGVAHNLTDADIAGVSAYFAGLSPMEPAPQQDETPPATPAQVETAETQITQVCSECHQEDMAGAPSGETPNLTIQNVDYIERQLYDFRSNRRDNSRMHQTAIRLDDEQIDALAIYLDGMEPLVRQPEEPVSTDLTLGEQIVRRGLPTEDVRACLTCHARENTENLPQIPNLHGQNANYLAARLDHFKTAEDEEITDYSPMWDIAQKMTTEQLNAAAAWFASQEPVAK
ncbi:c-type cytochrome [Palleronia pelagia]|uniref:Cytochrome c553 n=1 Tax=Palleronia pelagia TaxID=387096 RepID=A0A1H8DXG4_9RHOB|nr:c-type cytochrome [Palleronia pelagia]SEN11544.1 Cytochrome c553 [Palleronia pelagia]